VVVVSFMIAVPFPWDAHRGRPHPCYEHPCPDPTATPRLLSRIFWYAGSKRSDSLKPSVDTGAGRGRGRRAFAALREAFEKWAPTDYLVGWAPDGAVASS